MVCVLSLQSQCSSVNDFGGTQKIVTEWLMLDLWRPSGPTPMLKQGHLRQVAQYSPGLIHGVIGAHFALFFPETDKEAMFTLHSSPSRYLLESEDPGAVCGEVLLEQGFS